MHPILSPLGFYQHRFTETTTKISILLKLSGLTLNPVNTVQVYSEKSKIIILILENCKFQKIMENECLVLNKMKLDHNRTMTFAEWKREVQTFPKEHEKTNTFYSPFGKKNKIIGHERHMRLLLFQVLKICWSL